MSALAKPVAGGRRYQRVGVRDGRIVLLKVCSGPCGEEKVCTPGPDSDFPPNGKKSNGQPAWKSSCKVCYARARKDYVAENRERILQTQRAYYKRRKEESPTWAAELRARGRDAKRRAAADPVKLERKRKRDREWKRRTRKTQDGRDRLNENNRIWRALRRERLGAQLTPRVGGTVVDGTAPRAPARPFREWFAAYCEADNLTIEEAAFELGLGERYVTRLLAGRGGTVAVDVVSRALTNARFVVYLQGRAIVTINDLYGDDFSVRGTKGKAR